MTKTLLTLTACNATGGQVTPVESNSFSVPINPAELSQQLKIEYDKCVPAGRSSSDVKFAGMRPSSLSFSLVLDSTFEPVSLPDAGLRAFSDGIPQAQAEPPGVRQQLDALLKVVYVLDGTKHEPNIVQVVWGSFLFVGRLSTMDIQYTLFKPSGDPLRAKLKLGFSGYQSNEAESKRTNKSSPDLSHSVLVRAGDTLPLMCQRVYGDGRYYLAVARFNGLDGFRRLRPGTRLHFPPLQ